MINLDSPAVSLVHEVVDQAEAGCPAASYSMHSSFAKEENKVDGENRAAREPILCCLRFLLFHQSIRISPSRFDIGIHF
jgi:hypothetical protein